MSHDLLNELRSVARENSFAEWILQKQPKAGKYNSKVPLGWNRYGIFEVDFKNAPRIAIIAPTRTGKTFLTSSIMNYAYFNGILPFVMTDYKREYMYSSQKIASRFWPLVNPDYAEKLKIFSGLPMLPIIPQFIKRIDQKNTRIKSFQLKLQEMRRSDFLTLLNLKINKDYAVLDNINLLLKPFDKGGFLDIDFTTLLNIIKDDKQFMKVTNRMGSRAGLKKLRVLMDDIEFLEVLGSDHEFSLRDALRAKNIVDVCFYEGEDHLNYMQTYVAIMQRRLNDLKFNDPELGGKGKPMLEILDEPRKVAPSGAWKPASKTSIAEAVQMGAASGLSMVFPIADAGRTDNVILSQCQYFFITKGTQKDDRTKVYEKCGLSLETQIQIENAIEQCDRTPAGQPWVCISRDTSEVDVFMPYSPLGGIAP